MTRRLASGAAALAATWLLAAPAIDGAGLVPAARAHGDHSQSHAHPSPSAAPVAAPRDPALAGLADARRRAEASPNALAPALAAARLHLDHGRARAETAPVEAALGLLEPFLGRDASVEALLVAADARQHLHDFAGADALLDRAVAMAPSHAGVRFAAAALASVEGRLADAEADCAELARLRRLDLALMCRAQARATTARGPAAGAALAAALDVGRVVDGAMLGHARALVAEIAWIHGAADAAARLEAAAAAAPEDRRTRALLADLHLAAGRPAAAKAWLSGLPDADAVAVRRVEAALALDEPGAEAAAETLDVRLADAHRGHEREAARLRLGALDDAEGALAIALANWERQKEAQDLALLLDAAAAAGRPEAAAPAHAWMAETGAVVPAFAAVARKGD